MLCCLIGGALLTVLARAHRGGRARDSVPLAGFLAVALGLAVGMFLLELVVSALTLFGSLRATGALAARLALLILPAAVAVVCVAAGAGNRLADRQAVLVLTLAVAAGSLAAEELDLHLLDLHRAHDALGWAMVHLSTVGILVAGSWAGRSVRPIRNGQECEHHRAAAPASSPGDDGAVAQLPETGTSAAPHAHV